MPEPYTGSGPRHSTISVTSDSDFMTTPSVSVPFEELADNDVDHESRIVTLTAGLAAVNSALPAKADLAGAEFSGTVSVVELMLGLETVYNCIAFGDFAPASQVDQSTASSSPQILSAAVASLSGLEAGDVVEITLEGLKANTTVGTGFLRLRVVDTTNTDIDTEVTTTWLPIRKTYRHTVAGTSGGLTLQAYIWSVGGAGTVRALGDRTDNLVWSWRVWRASAP